MNYSCQEEYDEAMAGQAQAEAEAQEYAEQAEAEQQMTKPQKIEGEWVSRLKVTCSPDGFDGPYVWIDGELVKDKNKLTDFISDLLASERQRCVDIVKQKNHRWHIRFENTSDPEVNYERKKFNDEVSELINSVVEDIDREISNQT